MKYCTIKIKEGINVWEKNPKENTLDESKNSDNVNSKKDDVSDEKNNW